MIDFQQKQNLSFLKAGMFSNEYSFIKEVFLTLEEGHLTR